jgi:hypothetical protein
MELLRSLFPQCLHLVAGPPLRLAPRLSHLAQVSQGSRRLLFPGPFLLVRLCQHRPVAPADRQRVHPRL